jgi:hypothetical protein
MTMIFDRGSLAWSGRLLMASVLTLASFVLIPRQHAQAQGLTGQSGEVVPRDIREMYDRGLQYLASSQTDKGDWAGGGEQGPGVTGMAVLALLASGEDANFGLYSSHIRKALRSIINAQDAATGFFGMSMYHHGFATLALAEAYGAVDERNLWPDGKPTRSIGQSGDHLAEKQPDQRLAILAKRSRRGHLGQRRGPGRPARGQERRDRGS